MNSFFALVNAEPINHKDPRVRNKVIEKKKFAAEIGPCFFPFLENCLTGPYFFSSFILSSGNLSGDSSSSNSYRHD